jgi:hypothetical protein
MRAPQLKRWEVFCLWWWGQDLLWWPFVSLRPAPARRASMALVLGLSIAGTAVASGATLIVMQALALPFATPRFLIGTLVCFVLVTALLALSFARPWNRRARLLAAEMQPRA